MPTHRPTPPLDPASPDHAGGDIQPVENPDHTGKDIQPAENPDHAGGDAQPAENPDRTSGDTQPAGDPDHVPMHEDHEDAADLDKFMPDRN